MNRVFFLRDIWWVDYERICGGKYIKIKEFENYGVKKSLKLK